VREMKATTIKLLKEASRMKKAGGDLYPSWSLTGSVTLVCDTVDALVTDERVHEVLDEIGITENEYEDAKKELEIIADIQCFEALELDP
jgi:hypothetical protein